MWLKILAIPFAPVYAIMLYPVLAIVPGAIFYFFYFRTNSKSHLVTSVLWGLYGIYEQGMKSRVLCTGECNIRVDLLIIAPLLLAFSVRCVWSFCRRKGKLA